MATNETVRQRELFEMYYAMGKNRSIKELAQKEEVEVSERTIYNYSNKFNWKERVRQRDIEINKEISEMAKDEIIDAKAEYRRMIRDIVRKAKEDILAEDLKVEDISDLERLIKLDLTLMGEASEIKENNNTTQITERDKKLMEQLGNKVDFDDDVEVDDEEFYYGADE